MQFLKLVACSHIPQVRPSSSKAHIDYYCCTEHIIRFGTLAHSRWQKTLNGAHFIHITCAGTHARWRACTPACGPTAPLVRRRFQLQFPVCTRARVRERGRQNLRTHYVRRSVAGILARSLSECGGIFKSQLPTPVPLHNGRGMRICAATPRNVHMRRGRRG